MIDEVFHQFFLPKPVGDPLETLAAEPGVSKSAILTDAVTARLNRRDASRPEGRFAIRLDRRTGAIGRLGRDGHIQLETLALFVGCEIAIQAPLSENDHAGCALATKQLGAFIAGVGRRIAADRRTLANGIGNTARGGQ